VGLLALAVVPLFYPLVDVTNWLRLAAARSGRDGDSNRGQRQIELRGVFRTCAVDTALMWLFICMLGAIAAIAVGAQGGAAVETFGQRLVAAGDIAAVVSPLLLICVLAAAISTMGALFSACLCTIRYDMLALHWPEPPERTDPAREPMARRRTLVAGGVLALAVAVTFFVADAFLRSGFASNTFVALLLALCCAQLSFAPLVLGPICDRGRVGSRTVSAGWAMVILGVGAASGAIAVVSYLVSGVEAWLWSAVPACLGSGMVLFAIARAASRRGG
jgi:hypothetical protein